MSGKLDQSLDQIMQDSGSTGRRRGGPNRPNARRAAQKAKAAIAAPTGGVQKSARGPAKAPPRAPAMAAPRKPALTGDSKVMISGLPQDVDEPQLKEYIQKAIGGAKKVMITYGPDGRSRGIATVIFGNRPLATKCVDVLNNVKIDQRPLRVEFVVDASQAATAAPVKGLADRMSKPKSAAKEVKAAPKGKAVAPTNGAANGAAKIAKGGRGKKAGNTGRPKKKTADELDAEMTDYFGSGAAAANGAVQPAAAAATNGAEPVDEVM